MPVYVRAVRDIHIPEDQRATVVWSNVFKITLGPKPLPPIPPEAVHAGAAGTCWGTRATVDRMMEYEVTFKDHPSFAFWLPADAFEQLDGASSLYHLGRALIDALRVADRRHPEDQRSLNFLLHNDANVQTTPEQRALLLRYLEQLIAANEMLHFVPTVGTVIEE